MGMCASVFSPSISRVVVIVDVCNIHSHGNALFSGSDNHIVRSFWCWVFIAAKQRISPCTLKLYSESMNPVVFG